MGNEKSVMGVDWKRAEHIKTINGVWWQRISRGFMQQLAEEHGTLSVRNRAARILSESADSSFVYCLGSYEADEAFMPLVVWWLYPFDTISSFPEQDALDALYT